jgi:dihydrofolate reductase
MKKVVIFSLLLFGVGLTHASGQTCTTASELDVTTKTTLENTLRQYQQDSASLLQNAEFNLGNIVENSKALFAGQAAPRSIFLLDNTQPSGQRAEFFCGIYNSPDRMAFVFGSLPTGRYAIAIQDVTGNTPGMITWILHQAGAQWKVAGLYPKPKQVAGHDGNWYLSQARAFRAKGQAHNAWFYYLIANDMLRPFPSMSTPELDRLYDEIRASTPKDIPTGTPVDLIAGGRTFKITEMFATPVGDTLNLVVKHQTPDISDSTRTYQDNLAVIKALVAKYPEIREAFGGIVARAVAPNGQDFGTLLAMKDVK